MAVHVPAPLPLVQTRQTGLELQELPGIQVAVEVRILRQEPQPPAAARLAPGMSQQLELTGVGVDELTNTAKPPALGVKPPTPGNTISSIISAPPSVSTKRSMLLLFQGNRQKSPTVRSGPLNGGMRSPFDKKPGGR